MPFELPLLLAQAAEASAVAAPVAKPYAAIGIGGSALLVALIAFDYFTRAGTIARATTKEAMRQPIFLLLTAISIVIIGANYYVPFFSLGEDTKMFLDCGLATILISSLLLSIWTASISVAEEIEGRTAMTLLSKPITRRQFIVGKFVGISQTALAMICITGLFFFVVTYFKVRYDNKEAAKEVVDLFNWTTVSWLPFQVPGLQPEYLSVAAYVLPGLTLIFFEATVMTAVSVAISTRLPMLVNIVSCFAIFVIGHLTPVLVVSTLKDKVFVKFMAQLFATVLPTLDNFNMSAAVSSLRTIPPDYIGLSGAYCAVYSTAAVLLAFILFEDRDLA